ncbi:50S ribosomal protein L33 [Candidatus Berkelbacteria bacterium CG06_land_8_20_14_3_00_43_10]|uniref:Large ribosomal subunit protein bL33 n=1 Tax=Candidatus Berkelbacteria bacterium CG10_big_fil_rev_8_21_14_0_10_43_14 TaxID=1974515 RepID=A0A2M6R804_9BACT|nr:MAG: 50S ribosomal protein L33 [Candidatus Berkelbacteria bacterium CG10_big_fil_rev_8_21_14_0_10_43_14]PIU87433.1 MAG: 50S ribosomal protein L33 [Candidatus Berkelbacteria bacterium CG06_land_8_20_14_3_00_43_10]
MAKSKKKSSVVLACSVCKERNYTVNKSRGKLPAPVKLEINKFCNVCRAETMHGETK